MRLRNLQCGGALLALILLASAGCGGDKSPVGPGGKEPPRPASIALSKNSHAFTALRDSVQLAATVLDEKGAALAGASIAWVSTDTAVVQVSASGWIFAARVGTAHVIATSGVLADTALVEVEQLPAAIELSPDTLELAAGDTARVGAVVMDASDTPIEGAALTWTSMDPAVATVDDAGLVTGVAAGATRILAAAGEAADTISVTITAAGAGPGTGSGDDTDDGPVPTIVVITPASFAFDALGDSIRATAVVRDGEGAELTDAAVTWSSTNGAVATVDANGWVRARASGTASIIARAGTAADTVEVEVAQLAVTLQLSSDSVVIGAGKTLQLTVEVEDRNGHRISGAPITWSMENSLVATVASNGLVTGKLWGRSTKLTAGTGALSVTVPVTVLDQIVFVDAGGKILLINEDGSGERELLAANGRYPAWSPDGARIAYELASSGTTGNIWVMDADGTNKKQLTTDGNSRWPAWSPDGNKIAFIRDIILAGYEIYTINSNGTGELRRTNNTASDYHPVWSPDGKRLAFQSDRTGKSRLYVMELASSVTTEVTGATPSVDWLFPEWSPDGGEILFHAVQSGETVLGIADASSTTRSYWAMHPGAIARYGKWSSSGKKILYRVENAGLYIWRLDVVRGPIRVTSRGGTESWVQHAWRPTTTIIIVPPIIFP